MKENILGYQVDILSANECADSIIAAMNQNRAGAWFACLNPHSYVLSLSDELFSKALKNSDWLVPDGIGIVVASRILGGRIRGRLTGSDVFYTLQQKLNAKGGASVFFLGATNETLKIICGKMAEDYPNIRVAGTYAPPFKAVYSPDELDKMINAINDAEPDVLWVGMTAPKQEKWIFENRARLNVKFAGAIGAVFDFYSGQVRRSHPIFQRFGLEWLPRLLKQPRKLWRRNFISTPLFLWYVFRKKLSLKVN